jgi:hypothetical protein
LTIHFVLAQAQAKPKKNEYKSTISIGNNLPLAAGPAQMNLGVK